MEHVTNMKPLVSEFKWRWVQVADKPFDKGSIRLAYYGRRLHPVNDDSDPSADSYRCQGKVMKFKLEEDTVFKEYLTLPTRPELDRPRYEGRLCSSLLSILVQALMICCHWTSSRSRSRNANDCGVLRKRV